MVHVTGTPIPYDSLWSAFPNLSRLLSSIRNYLASINRFRPYASSSLTQLTITNYYDKLKNRIKPRHRIQNLFTLQRRNILSRRLKVQPNI